VRSYLLTRLLHIAFVRQPTFINGRIIRSPCGEIRTVNDRPPEAMVLQAFADEQGSRLTNSYRFI
jgi:hypothetical protein